MLGKQFHERVQIHGMLVQQVELTVQTFHTDFGVGLNSAIVDLFVRQHVVPTCSTNKRADDCKIYSCAEISVKRWYKLIQHVVLTCESNIP